MITNFFESGGTSGADIGTKYVTKNYLMDNYPSLLPMFKSPALFGAGYNVGGILGNSTFDSSDVFIKCADRFIKISHSGASNGIGIKTDGTLWVWGDNTYGQIGNGNATGGPYSIPQQVGIETNWKSVLSGATYISSTLGAIKNDGTLWLWGKNTDSQIGDGSSTQREIPTQTSASGSNWKQVSLGHLHTAATKNDGTLWVWGANTKGQLGTNAASSAVYTTPTQLGTDTDWKFVTCGLAFTAAIKNDGSLWLWGENTYSQLGIINNTDSFVPVQTAASGNNWKEVSCGYYHTLAIKTDGSMWSWGFNSSGQLGQGNNTLLNVPTQIGNSTNWKYVTAADANNSTAIKTDGTLWVWGGNTQGQLGTGDTVDSWIPIQVGTATNWKQSTGSNNHIAAISELEEF